MRLVPIECVKDGCFLGKTIYDDQGRPLLKSGVALTSNLIKKIKDIHIYSIYIQDEYSDHELEDIIKPELRQKSIKIIKELFDNVENMKINGAYLSAKNLNLILREKRDSLLSLRNLAEELLDNVLSNKNILVNLVDIKSMDNFTYQHSVNVAILSLVLGIGLKLNKKELLDLCIGSLLHDIGKVFIPKDIIFKDKKLTDKEVQLIETHPKKGYDYIKGASYISPNVKMIILQHHERVDGLGYPNKLNSEKINKLSKIVSLADYYDILTSDIPCKRALSPNEAFEYILAGSSTLFEYEIVKVFSKLVIPFNEGTIVKLSNGDIGIVIENNYEYPLRPKIKIIKSNNLNSIDSIVNLVDELSLVICSVEYNV